MIGGNKTLKYIFKKIYVDILCVLVFRLLPFLLNESTRKFSSSFLCLGSLCLLPFPVSIQMFRCRLIVFCYTKVVYFFFFFSLFLFHVNQWTRSIESKRKMLLFWSMLLHESHTHRDRIVMFHRQCANTHETKLFYIGKLHFSVDLNSVL